MADSNSTDKQQTEEEKRLEEKLAKSRAKWRRWKEKNPERYAECRRKQTAKRKVKQREYDQNRYWSDPEKERARVAKYREENREAIREMRKKAYPKIAAKMCEYNKRRRAANRALLDQIIRQSSCVACGESDFRCLEFHHIDESTKHAELARMIGYSRKRLLAEIALCEIRCKNCHIRVHAKNGIVRYWRGEDFKGGKPKPRPLSDKVDPKKREYMRALQKQPKWKEYNRRYQRERYRKNKAIADAIKAERGCERCGEKDVVCLQFHHRDPERRTAGVTALCGFSSHRMMAEIAICDVICGNCHCKEHYEERRGEPWQRKRRVRQLELPFDETA